MHKWVKNYMKRRKLLLTRGEIKYGISYKNSGTAEVSGEALMNGAKSMAEALNHFEKVNKPVPMPECKPPKIEDHKKDEFLLWLDGFLSGLITEGRPNDAKLSKIYSKLKSLKG